MIKKIILVLFIFLLTSCGVNKKNLFHITVNDEEIIVGYNKADHIFTSFEDKKQDEDGVLTSATFYLKDYDKSIIVDDIELSPSIIENSLLFEGYMSGDDYVVEKKVSGKINRIIIYNNILNDDLDVVDHITISYE